MLIKHVRDKKSVCGCVYLYPCDFTYVCIASELIRGADLTALVPEPTEHAVRTGQRGKFQYAWKGYSPAQTFCPNGVRF